MSFSHCFLAGIPNKSEWSQAYTHKLEDSVFGMILSVGDPVADPSLTGKEIYGAGMSLATTVNREEFLAFFKKWGRPGVSLAALYMYGNRALLFAQGEVEIGLVRGGNKQVVLRGKTEAQFVEGEFVPGDYYVLGTQSYFKELSSVDTLLSPQENCDQAAVKIHQLGNSGKIAAALIKVTGEEQKGSIDRISVYKGETSFPQKETVSSLQKTRSLNLKMDAREKLRLFKSARVLKLAVAVIGILLALVMLNAFLTNKKSAGLEKAIGPYRERYAKLNELPSNQLVDRLQGLRELARDLEDRRDQVKEASLMRAFEQLLSQVKQDFAAISGETHLEKLNVFYDFRLIAPDFVASAVGYDEAGELAVFLDSGHSRLLSLSLEKKEALTLSVDENLDNPFSLAVQNRKAYALGPQGIMELSLPLDRLGSMVLRRDSTWNNPKFIQVFGTNGYVFDSGARNILKHDLDDPASSPSSWLRSKEGLDFDQVTSFNIDGDVWLGTNQGAVFHYRQGGSVDFSYQGVLDKPSSSVYLFSREESELLYVLEPAAKRILVLTKQGEYRKAITSDDLATATGLIVNEKSNKAYVLSGSLVYEVGI